MPSPKVTRSEQLSFRAEPALVERIDELRAAMKRRLRGVDLSRSDIMKTLIEQSLPLMEIEYMTDRESVAAGGMDGVTALTQETIRAMLDVADAHQLDIEVPGYDIKKKR